MKLFEDARPVVKWLGSQQKVGGGYGSTQVICPLVDFWVISAKIQENTHTQIKKTFNILLFTAGHYHGLPGGGRILDPRQKNRI